MDLRQGGGQMANEVEGREGTEGTPNTGKGTFRRAIQIQLQETRDILTLPIPNTLF